MPFIFLILVLIALLLPTGHLFVILVLEWNFSVIRQKKTNNLNILLRWNSDDDDIILDGWEKYLSKNGFEFNFFSTYMN